MIAESEAGVKQSVPLPDMQKQDNPDSNVENVPCKDNLHQSDCSKTVLDGSDKSCTDGQYGNENSAQFEEVRKKTQHDAVDGNKDETETTTPVPVDGLKESPSSSHSEGNFPDNPMDDGIYEFTPPVSSHQEAIHFVAIETEQGEKVYATSHSDHGSLSEDSQSNICAENKAVNCDMDTLSFVDDNYFTGARVNPEPVNTSKSYSSSPELFCQTSLPGPVKVSSPGSSGDLSSQSVANDEKGSPSPSNQVNVSYASTNINAMVDEKIENLLVNDLDEATEGDENIGEDWNTFLSELHNTKNVFPSDYGQFVRSDLVKGCAPPTDEVIDGYPPGMDIETVDVEKTAYDPSSWTPMEIETATGNADCTLLEQPLKLRSTYAEVEVLLYKAFPFQITCSPLFDILLYENDQVPTVWDGPHSNISLL